MFLRRCYAFVCFLLPSFSLAESPQQPHVVILIAESEYQTHESLPAFSKQFLQDYRTTFVFDDPEDKNRLVGIEAVDSADVLFVSVRRRTLTKDQLDVVRRYVAAGKPVVGIRTASHAFCLRNQDPPEGRVGWPEFDREVFGGNYTNHYGNALKAIVTRSSIQPEHSATLLDDLESTEPFIAGGSLYQVSPLADVAVVLFAGRVEGQSSEPVAWTYVRADGGKSFYTSLGHVDDFHGNVLPRLLVNATKWSLQQ